ncbi:MAG: hypothetical protein J1F40_00485 [Prevotellaceae bacterium]|nr:hypothetical protein [Prevotellaceae bacterium]
MRKQGDSGMVGADLRRLLCGAERYLRLEATDKATVVVTIVALVMVALVLSVSSVFFIGTGLVKSLTLLIGSEILSYFCVGIALLLVVVLLFVCRKPLIERPILRMLSKKILDGKMLTDNLAPDTPKEVDLHELAKSLALEMEMDAMAKGKKGGER